MVFPDSFKSAPLYFADAEVYLGTRLGLSQMQQLHDCKISFSY